MKLTILFLACFVISMSTYFNGGNLVLGDYNSIIKGNANFINGNGNYLIGSNANVVQGQHNFMSNSNLNQVSGVGNVALGLDEGQIIMDAITYMI